MSTYNVCFGLWGLRGCTFHGYVFMMMKLKKKNEVSCFVVSSDFRDLIKKLLVQDRTKRLGNMKVKNHLHHT